MDHAKQLLMAIYAGKKAYLPDAAHPHIGAGFCAVWDKKIPGPVFLGIMKGVGQSFPDGINLDIVDAWTEQKDGTITVGIVESGTNNGAKFTISADHEPVGGDGKVFKNAAATLTFTVDKKGKVTQLAMVPKGGKAADGTVGPAAIYKALGGKL